MSCLSLVDCDPVCCGKPFVALDVVHAVLQVAIAFCQIHLQQVSQQILQVGAEVGGEPHLERRRNMFRIHVFPAEIWGLYMHTHV